MSVFCTSDFRGLEIRSLTVTALEQLLFGTIYTSIIPLVDLGCFVASMKELKLVSLFILSQ
jgi:hypothetical protein